jgi:hypothetical protein
MQLSRELRNIHYPAMGFSNQRVLASEYSLLLYSFHALDAERLALHHSQHQR